MYFTNLGVYALIIGNVTFPMFVCIMNINSVKKLVGYRFNFIGMLVKPLIAGAIMGLATGAVYYGGMHLMANDGRLYKLIWMIIAMAVAGVTYGTGVIVTKAVTVDELSRMPIIKKFIK